MQEVMGTFEIYYMQSPDQQKHRQSNIGSSQGRDPLADLEASAIDVKGGPSPNRSVKFTLTADALRGYNASRLVAIRSQKESPVTNRS